MRFHTLIICLQTLMSWKSSSGSIISFSCSLKTFWWQCWVSRFLFSFRHSITWARTNTQISRSSQLNGGLDRQLIWIYLSVSKHHVLTVQLDVLPTALEQLRLQTNVLRLNDTRWQISTSPDTRHNTTNDSTKRILDWSDVLTISSSSTRSCLRHFMETRCSLPSCKVSFLTVVLRQITTSTLRVNRPSKPSHHTRHYL